MNENEDSEHRSGGAAGIVILLVLIGGFIWWWKTSQASWTGFYYPTQGDTLKYVSSPQLKSLEECRNWVNAQVNKYNPSGYGYDYECGKNCKLRNGNVGLYECKETDE